MKHGKLFFYCFPDSALLQDVFFCFFLQVKQYLEAVESGSSLTAPSSGNKKDSTEFTDMQLLAWLEQFQEKNQDLDEELQYLLGAKYKVSSVAVQY